MDSEIQCLASKIFFNLFYYQIKAATDLAFNEFCLTDQCANIEKLFGREKAVELFLTFYIEDYMINQIKKHPFQIMFFPWTVLENPEFYEWRD